MKILKAAILLGIVLGFALPPSIFVWRLMDRLEPRHVDMIVMALSMILGIGVALAIVLGIGRLNTPKPPRPAQPADPFAPFVVDVQPRLPAAPPQLSSTNAMRITRFDQAVNARRRDQR